MDYKEALKDIIIGIISEMRGHIMAMAKARKPEDFSFDKLYEDRKAFNTSMARIIAMHHLLVPYIEFIEKEIPMAAEILKYSKNIYDEVIVHYKDHIINDSTLSAEEKNKILTQQEKRIKKMSLDKE